MSKVNKKIHSFLEEEIKIFEKKIYESMKSGITLLNQIIDFINFIKGKKIRPILIFLIAKMLGKVNEKTYRAALLVEFIHAATLVHDDVIDESHIRRGFFSVNVLWTNKIAVLVGDYLFSKSLIISIKNKDFDLLEIISHTIKDMSEGELLQLKELKKNNISENMYYEIIRKKTAVLIAASCACAVSSVDNNVDIKKQLYKFGELAGIAFQIKDDLLDYVDINIIDESINIDIEIKKMTLPFIYVLNNIDFNSKKSLICLLKNHNNDIKKINKILNFIKKNGGIEYANKKMNYFKNKALMILDTFPISKSQIFLKLMVNYMIERKK